MIAHRQEWPLSGGQWEIARTLRGQVLRLAWGNRVPGDLLDGSDGACFLPQALPGARAQLWAGGGMNHQAVHGPTRPFGCGGSCLRPPLRERKHSTCSLRTCHCPKAGSEEQACPRGPPACPGRDGRGGRSAPQACSALRAAPAQEPGGRGPAGEDRWDRVSLNEPQDRQRRAASTWWEHLGGRTPPPPSLWEPTDPLQLPQDLPFGKCQGRPAADFPDRESVAPGSW